MRRPDGRMSRADRRACASFGLPPEPRPYQPPAAGWLTNLALSYSGTTSAGLWSRVPVTYVNESRQMETWITNGQPVTLLPGDTITITSTYTYGT